MVSDALDLHIVQDEPYYASVGLLDDLGVVQALPAGELRMQLRPTVTSSVIILDASALLSRVVEDVIISIPASVTIGLPARSYYDLWVGDSRLISGRALVDFSATRRAYP